MTACLRELIREDGVELLVYAHPPQANAPFDASLFAELGEVRDRTQFADGEIEAAALRFRPDAVLVSGWFDAGYRKVCRTLKQKGALIVAGCDTQWSGSIRQKVASVIAPYHLHRFIDILWVTGERQKALAKRLGYTGKACWEGFYACDWACFARVGIRRLGLDRDSHEQAMGELELGIGDELPRARFDLPDSNFFLYVGRYAPEKGLDTLAEAYRSYCKQVDNPWELVCAGSGPNRDILIQSGAQDLGFVAPHDLPAIFERASVFILPSRYEPWGVVAQEAGASGLPLILSEASGAAVHLLRDRWNGRLFPAGDAAALCESMQWVTSLDAAACSAMARNSFELARQYTPAGWARTLKDGLDLQLK